MELIFSNTTDLKIKKYFIWGFCIFIIP